MSRTPQKNALRFFRWFCDPDYVEDIEGDLLERFQKRLAQKEKANWLLMLDIVKLFRPGIIKNFEGNQKLNYYGMLKHNLKIGWRNILRERSTSLINIIGLSAAAAVCILTLIFYRYETSFDQHHELADKTYRVVQTTQRPDTELFWGTTAYPLAAALRNDFPDFELVTQTAGPTKRLFSYQRMNTEKVLFEEENVLFADQYYPQVFDFEWLAGDPTTSLVELNSVVITEQVAEKCFGKIYNPAEKIGETLLLNNKDQLVVTGIIKNNRPNINLKANMIVSYQFFKKHNPYPTGNWSGNYQGTTFTVLNNPNQKAAIEEKINDWKGKYLNEDDNQTISYALQPLNEIHTATKYGATPQGYQIPKRTLNISLLAAGFILVIAIINFINLVTANASVRSREVGIRKVIGGRKGMIVSQFIVENFILVGLSFLLALGVVFLMLDVFNELLTIIDLDLTIQLSDVLIVLVCFIFAALLATIYPSIILSSFDPLTCLTNKGKSSNRGVGLRKALTFFQFTIVQIFVIAAMVIGLQLNYFDNKSLGFNSEKIVSIYLPSFDKKEVFVNQLLAKSEVKEVSVGSGPPMAVENFALGTRYRKPHQEVNDGLGAEMKIIDSTYLSLYTIPLIAGRNVKENRHRFDEFIVTRGLVESMSWTPDEAIGQRLAINEGEATIVGVVEDFHNHSLQNDLTPVVLMNWHAFQMNAFVKVSSFSTLVDIEEIWRSLFPEKIFSYRFVEDSMEKEYAVENLIFTGFKFFSILVIIIAGLGLFGLVSFLTIQKTKEIGIRKVLGASITEILLLFNKQFSVLIILGFLASIPIVWYIMNQWLNTFPYRISISIWVFVLGGLSTFVLGSSIAILKSYKTASLNPALTLKDE